MTSQNLKSQDVSRSPTLGIFVALAEKRTPKGKTGGGNDFDFYVVILPFDF